MTKHHERKSSDIYVGRVIEVMNPLLFRERVVFFRVFEIKGNRARIDWNDREDSEFGTWMPIESVDHFESDLNGTVSPRVVDVVTTRGYHLTVPRYARDAIDAIIDGNAELLGKGDDGVVFRVGDLVVKMSTTVPYQPMNPGHRTPVEARDQMVKQAELSNRLSREVHGIPFKDVVTVADKAFIIRPYYDIPNRLTKDQLDQVAITLGELHSRGYVLGDSDAFQVGVDDAGRVQFFDLDKIQKGKHSVNRIFDDFETERSALRTLYAKHGHPFIPPPGPLLEVTWADAIHKRPWFLWLDIDIVSFEQLAQAAVDARIPDAAQDANRVREWIGDAIAKEETETK